ncbi:MAG: TIGR01212 family radical SAM protein [Nitrospira sp.]|nr:TIGR01212 family radical SAM protein [Nitrospira sp.]
MVRRYNSFGSYIKKLFGTTVYKVNVDAGFTCPNRDGTLSTSGCIYCNNDSFRPISCKPTLSLREQIHNGIAHIRKRYKAEKFLVYFQPYTNTYAPVDELEHLYREALSEPSVTGLAIGTRPDTVDKEKIALLESLAEQYFILVEYGMQSMYDKTLEFINRGHDYHTFLTALDMTKNRGIFIGAHIIVGFPTETKEEIILMADEISHLPLEFLKIHQLQVIKDTPLEMMYRENPFHVFEYEEYLDFVIEFIERLSPRIVLQRLFATAPDSILIAPRWGKSRQEILRDIEKRLELKDTYQGKKMKIHAVI